jgi:hypothetical protein
VGVYWLASNAQAGMQTLGSQAHTGNPGNQGSAGTGLLGQNLESYPQVNGVLRKVSATKTVGRMTYMDYHRIPNGQYNFTILAYGPNDYPSGIIPGTELGDSRLKNRCSTQVSFTLNVNRDQPPRPIWLRPAIPADLSELERGFIDLSWAWYWSPERRPPTAAGNVSFEVVYTVPRAAERSVTGFSSPTGTDNRYEKRFFSVIEKRGKNTFSIRAIVNGVKSELSPEVSVEYDANGKFLSMTQQEGTVITLPSEKVNACKAGGQSVVGVLADPLGSLDKTLNKIICEMVVLARDFFTFLLRSSMNLLIITAGLPSHTVTSDSGLLFDGLKKTAFNGRIEYNLTDSNMGQIARSAYSRILTFANFGVLLLLIVIALANILQIQINTYSIKKLLPGLIIGLLLANASFFIVRSMLELSGYAASGLISADQVDERGDGPTTMLTQFLGFGDVGKGKPLTNQQGDINLNLVFQQAVMNLFILIAAVLVFILGFLFALRSLIFYILVPLAPLAFIGLFFPPLNKIWGRWWSLVVNWTFMNVVAFFWLWLGFTWMASVPPVDEGEGVFGYLINYVFGIAMIYLAMKTPFTLAGEAKTYLNKWNDFGKGIGMQYTPYGAGNRALNQIKSNMAQKQKLAESGPIVQNRVARKLGGDAVNKWSYKMEHKTQQKKEEQAALEAKLKNDARDELVNGKEGWVAKMKKSQNEHVRKLGEVLDNKKVKVAIDAAKIAATFAINPVLGAAVAAKVGLDRGKDTAAGKWMQSEIGGRMVSWDLAAPLSYQKRQHMIRDYTEEGKLAKDNADASIAKSYYKDEVRGLGRAQRIARGAATAFAVEKAENDAKDLAAHTFLREQVQEARDSQLVGRLQNDGLTHVENLSDIVNLNTASITDANLRQEVEEFQTKHKGIFKHSAKHLAKKHEEDASAHAKKKAAEVQFTTDIEKNAAVSILNKEDPANPTLDPGDHSDAVARLAGLAQIISSGSRLEDAPEAIAAARALLDVVNRPNYNGPANAATHLNALIQSVAQGILNGKREEVSKAIGAFKQTAIYSELIKRRQHPGSNYQAV